MKQKLVFSDQEKKSRKVMVKGVSKSVSHFGSSVKIPKGCLMN